MSGDDDDDTGTDDHDDDAGTDDHDDNGDDDNGDADEIPDISPPQLTLNFENEGGDPVSQGFSLEIDDQDSGFVFTRNYIGRASEPDEIEDGQASFEWNDGTYDVTIEPAGDGDFETAEDEFTFDDEDEELTFELVGATGDPDIPPLTMEGTYRIDNYFSELSLGVEDGSDEPGSTVVQQEWEDEEYQHWSVEVVDEDEGYHRFESVASGLVWEIEDADTDEEGAAHVVVGEWEEADHQLWTIQLGDEDNHVIRNVNSGIAIELDGDSQEPGEVMLQWPYGDGPTEKFVFEAL